MRLSISKRAAVNFKSRIPIMLPEPQVKIKSHLFSNREKQPLIMFWSLRERRKMKQQTFDKLSDRLCDISKEKKPRWLHRRTFVKACSL